MTASIAPPQSATAQWTFRPLAHLLPNGLPVGGLTLVSVPTQSVRRGPWSTVVGQLILDVLDRCQPALYTYADDPYAACWPEEGVNPLGPHYLSVPDWCGGDAGTDANADCSATGLAGATTPLTLQNVTAALREHEHWHGPSLVVIDNFNGARPYDDPSSAPAAGTAEAVVTETEALRSRDARIRVSELEVFALHRPAAPTVAVWRRWPAQAAEEAALSDVALLHITAYECERRHPIHLSVRTRPDLGAPWSADTPVVLPWFDWGFDDRDLDAEDLQAIDQKHARAANAQPGPAPDAIDPWAVPAPGAGGNA